MSAGGSRHARYNCNRRATDGRSGLPIIKAKDLPRDGLRFVIEHATEDVKHATFFKYLILDVVTRYPSSAKAMLRCFDYFHAVYPLPIWDEAFQRAMEGDHDG